MNKNLSKIAAILNLTMLIGITNAGIDFGADLVSRYVWRGTDFGNSASVQPFLSLSIEGFEAGAWASYPLTDASASAGNGANENDLYINYTTGPVGIGITDYYFPESFRFGYYGNDSSASHILEGSVTFEMAGFKALGAVNFYGADKNHSFYLEGGYELFNRNDLIVSSFAGIGNYIYRTDSDSEPGLVNLGVIAAKGNLSVSYILNVQAEVDYLVFGYHIGL
jgi:hypothetical protein